MENRDKIIALLRSFIAQRPGMDPRNYGDAASYRAESRGITQDRHDAERLLREVELSPLAIPEAALREAFRAFSGRLTLTDGPNNTLRLDYCTGQYFPTEYRRAVCAVLSAALWDARRASMPPPRYIMGDGVEFLTKAEALAYAEERRASSDVILGMEERYGAKKQSAGDWIRSSFRAQFGQRIARRYFN
jgi:hypothetical protein